ncbi:hypothetical protein [Streptomyces sp. NPDC014676]|uniref:hypothetical protein n=1 Tax=Streptomyces sp. NPDC014676 TaxID=3364879 RepID=UPI0036F57C81
MPAHDEHRDPPRDNPAEPGPEHETPEHEEPTTHDHHEAGSPGDGEPGRGGDPARADREGGSPGDEGPGQGSRESGGSAPAGRGGGDLVREDDEGDSPGGGAPGHGGRVHDGDPVREGRDGDGPAPGGMDALMAVLLDEPLSARARQDPEVVAAHRAAVVDVAVLREQLALIGDALAGETADGEGAGAPAGRGGAGRLAGGPGAGPEPEAGPRSGDGPPAARPAVSPSAGGRPGTVRGRPGTVRGPRGPHRGRRRPLKAALGALVAAAAATVVVGMGWLVTQAGGMADSDAGGSAARADSEEAGGKDAGGVAFGSPRYLACARLVAEGAVLTVDPVPGAGAERVTLKASRYYKGEGEVTFLHDLAGDAPLHEGDQVLVGMPAEGVHPDTVVVGEADIAPERVRITASLPESRTLTCE